MRILLLNDDFPPEGRSSVAHIAYDHMRVLADAGHDVRVLTTHRTDWDAAVRRHGNVVSIPVSYRPSLRAWLSLKHRAVARALEEEIRAVRADVVHAHNVHMYLTYDALRIARRHAPRVFVSLHDVMSFSYRRLATKRFLDSGGEDCRVTIADQIAAAGIAWNPFRNAYIRKAFTNATKVLPVSTALEKALRQNGIGNTRVLHNATDVARWDDAGRGSADFGRIHGLEGKRVILFGGRLSEDKGIREILAAFGVVRRSVPDALLVIIGDKGRYDAYAAGNRDARTLSPFIRCTGWLSANEMRDAYHAADVVTTPSLCLDTFNMMNLEAHACGKPVVGTCFGGTKEVVVHGETGFICDPRDIDTYAGHLTKLLSDRDMAGRFGCNGRTRALELFDLGRYRGSLEELYGLIGGG